MKTHTSDFKNNIKMLGKEIDSKITYTENNTTIELGNEQLNSVTPHYEGGILKSVMKQLDIDSNVEIPVGTILTYQFGVKVGNSYEYISYGNYVVKEVEKQEDTMSYKITCYDKMLYSMIPYEAMSITYPITIRNYISAICTKLGLTFKNSNSTFANYNKQITKELYLDSNGKDLGYTFRDVLDELAQVTASTICINENDDELEIRYINDTNDTIDEEFLKDVNVNFGEKFGAVNTIVLSRSAGADNIYYPSTLPANPIEIKISDNQIMNGNDRDTFMADIYSRLNGLEYYINDFSSTGICYYNLCDRYSVTIGENTYSCVMFNDEVNITQGLQESIYTDMPKESVTDYTKADKTDRRINQTTLIVDKQQSEITALVDTTEDIQKEINPTDTTTGSSIYLEDSGEAPLINFELEGKTTQETRSGKNLINILGYHNEGYSETVNGLTITYQNDGSIKVNGTASANTTYILYQGSSILPAGQYTFSGSVGGSYSTYRLEAAVTPSYSYFHSLNGSETLNLSSQQTLWRVYLIIQNGTQLSNKIFYPMLEKGNTTTEYEPYGVMPSPDYPSELVSVGYENYFEAEYLQTTANTNINANLYKDTYTLSLESKENFGGVIYIQLYKNNTLITTNGHLLNTSSAVSFSSSSYWYYFSNIPNGNKLTFTLDDDYSLKIALSNATGSQKAFLVKGTQQHSYIPYGKYGIEVKTIGKNLFDGVLEQGSVNSQGINNTNTTRLRTKNYISVYPNTTYALKVNENTTGKNLQFSISYYDKNDYTTYRLSYLNWTTSNPITFTTPNDCHYIRFLIAYTNGSTINTTDNISKIQIEKTQATTYEEYKSKTYLYTLNQPLRSIGDVKDLLYIKNGMLYVERKIGSATFKGTETWNLYSSNAVRTIFYTPISQQMESYTLTTDIPKLMSSHFIPASQNATWKNGDILRRTNENNIYLIVANGYTIDTFKTWLSTHNVEVQYLLASSNTEGLGKIEVPSTYKTITHIDTTDELQPNMNITYVMNTQITNYVQNQVNQIKITEDGILAEVNRKVDNEEIIAKLNLAIEDEQGIIEITGNQVTIDSDYFELNANGTIKSTGGTIGGYKITDNMLYAETFAKYNYTENDLDKIRNYLMGTGTLTPEEFIKYDVNESGTVTSLDYVTIKFFIEYNVTPTSSAKIIMQTGNSISDNAYVLQDGARNEIFNIGFNGIYYKDINLANTTTYSENELVVGKWIDNKPIYRKVIDIGNLPNASQTIVSHNISNIERIVKLYGSATRDSDKETMPIPYVTFNSNNSGGINLYANNVSVLVSTSSDRSSYTGYVVLEYTKTSD